MRILLINPWIYDFGAYDMWAKPLGLILLGGFLKDNGFDVELIDCMNVSDSEIAVFMKKNNLKMPKRNEHGSGKFPSEIISRPEILKSCPIPRRYRRYGIPLALFLEKLAQIEKPDIVMITSMMTYWYPAVRDIIRIIKKYFSGMKCVLGGIYATLCENHAKRVTGADFIIKGQFERNIPALEKILQRKLLLKKDSCQTNLIRGISLYNKISSGIAFLSRGCPFKCSFCASPLLSRGFSSRDTETVFMEIMYQSDLFGIRDFAFFDDALLFNKNIHSLLGRLSDRNLQFRFHTPNGLHPSMINQETAVLLKSAGFRTIKLGLEFTDSKFSRNIDGKVSFRRFEKGLECLMDAGFSRNELGVYLLMGVPGQSVNDLVKTIKILKNFPVKIHLNEYSPIPGTEDFNRHLKESGVDFENEPLFQNNTLLPLRSKLFSEKIIHELKMMVRI
jgi:radical SAM superfamily enzyme YgiQ (UPF0313 family)